MFSVPGHVKIFVALEPTDMRRGFPGLSGQVQSTLQQDPLSGHLFLFRNRRRDRIKILFWDGDGYAIYYKQLARGTFEIPAPQDPNSPVVQIRASELSMLLDGIELQGASGGSATSALLERAACSTGVHRVAWRPQDRGISGDISMETGHIVRFASQQHPFLVETSPCLDLDCRCSIITLTLLELAPSGSQLRDCLRFTLRVCLRTWTEQDPPPRSLEVESLAREFLVGFPRQRIEELSAEFQQARAIEKRLKSFSLSGSRDELVSYSSVVCAGRGIREGVTDESYFFVFEGREFLVEDHYCANPECDCQQVHLEFWERVHEFYPKRGITLQQRLMATFTLAGKLKEIRFSQESASTTRYLLRAWLVRCGGHFHQCQRRYDLIKIVGARSFPSESSEPRPEPPAGVLGIPERRSVKRPLSPIAAKQRVGRNAPCPCGSGLKYKRCCARRPAAAIDKHTQKRGKFFQKRDLRDRRASIMFSGDSGISVAAGCLSCRPTKTPTRLLSRPTWLLATRCWRASCSRWPKRTSGSASWKKSWTR